MRPPIEEIGPALMAVLAFGSLASLGSDELVHRRTNIYLHNAAAFMFFMFQRPDLAAREMKAIGEAYSGYPWVYGRGETKRSKTSSRARR